MREHERLERDSKIWTRLHRHVQKLKEEGYRPIYVGLYGSQNYGLDTELSDVDTKAIVLPEKSDLLCGQGRISHILMIDEEDRDQCDVKDIVTMVENWKKQNINYLEILVTEFYYVEPGFEPEMYKLRRLAEEIALYNPNRLLNSARGMALQRVDKIRTGPDTYSLKDYITFRRLVDFLHSWSIDKESFRQSIQANPLLRYAQEFPLSMERVMEDIESEKERMQVAFEMGLGAFTPYRTIEEEMIKVILSVHEKLVQGR